MNPNQKIFAYGSVALLAFSLLLGMAHNEESSSFATATAAEPVAAAMTAEAPEPAKAEVAEAAEPAAEEAVEAPAAEEAAAEAAPELPGEATTDEGSELIAAIDQPKTALQISLAADAEEAAGTKADEGSEPIAEAAASEPVATADAPADAKDSDCAKKKSSDCDKAKKAAGGDKGKSDCKGKKSSDCDKSKSDCKGKKGCDKGGCIIGGLACALDCKLDLSDEQQASIDALVGDYRVKAKALGSQSKQARQDLSALWEASPLKPKAVEKKAAEVNKLKADKLALVTSTKIALAATLQPTQFDRVDHLFSAACEWGKDHGQSKGHKGGKDCKGSSCKR